LKNKGILGGRLSNFCIKQELCAAAMAKLNPINGVSFRYHYLH
jgi:hypothetical protein